jgi:HlyD family secretion protein
MERDMKPLAKPLITGVLLVIAAGAAGIGVRAFYATRSPEEPAVATAQVTRGPIVDVVAATGALQAVTTVQVGTQVSGTISWLGADFNSIVRKGQVVARLDPSLFETQVEQSRANLTRASADLDNAQVRVTDAQQKYVRARELADRQLLALSDLDTAKINVDVAEAQLRSARAQVAQAEAAVNQTRLNLSYTVISAPIDGIVIGRSVDVGQTVAASLSSPTIFSIAADLADMQLSASIDESDIGRIRPAQRVTFQVDAYPDEQFVGTVAQVRLQPSVVQNVTTYNVMIDVLNPELKLKPGMTANVAIEIAARDDVVRVPNAALRFRPTAEVLAALGQPAGPSAQPGRQPVATSGTMPAAPAQVRLKPDTTDEGQVRLTPDTTGEGQVRLGPDTAGKGKAEKATTIDALFAPLVVAETEGRVWMYENNELTPVRVTLGVSDGQHTELVVGDLRPGVPLATNVTLAGSATTARSAPAPAGGLFMPGSGALPGANRGAANRGGGR